MGDAPVSASLDAADAALLGRLRAGDERAFEEVVRAHAGRFLAVARRLCGSVEDAQDAVQDAMVSAFRGLGTFTGEARLATWLHRIVINAALMRLRSRRSRPEKSIDALLPAFDDTGHHVDPPAPWSEPSEMAAMRSETRARVRESIAELPETYKTVLVLRDIEELSTEETAAVLGITANAVKVRLHRARQALRTLLDPHFRGDER
jgi:RNA polymerase sigma-70 factor (ECF subfamily)